MEQTNPYTLRLFDAGGGEGQTGAEGTAEETAGQTPAQAREKTAEPEQEQAAPAEEGAENTADADAGPEDAADAGADPAERGAREERGRQQEELSQQQEQAKAEARRRSQADYARWQREAEALGQMYPDFDLNREGKSRTFRALVLQGIPVRTAYEVMHPDALSRRIAGAVQAQMAAERASALARPTENGVMLQSGGRTREEGVDRMSLKQMESIARRALRGEHISFNR